MDCYVGVKGYIVGYIAGNQLSQSVFGVPEDAPNTNMLIADAPDVTDASLCMPVLLEPEEVRPMVNLYDHPDYYQCPVYVEGMVTTYFSVAGTFMLLSCGMSTVLGFRTQVWKFR